MMLALDNPFRKSPEELLFENYFCYFISRFPQTLIPFRLNQQAKDNLEHLLNYPSLSIVLATHNGFAFATKLISDRHQNILVLHGGRTGGTLKKTFKKSGINRDIPILRADKYCLSKLHEKLNENTIFICCIDERSPETREFDVINPNIFKFILRYEVNYLFYKDDLLDSGQIEIALVKPDIAKTPEELGLQFLNFLGDTKKYTINKNNRH